MSASNVKCDVLLVTAGLERTDGGPSNSVLLDAISLASAGATVCVAGTTSRRWKPSNRAELFDQAVASGVRIDLYPISRCRVAERWSASFGLVRRLVVSSQDRVWHLHAPWTVGCISALVIGRLRGIPTVVTPRECFTDFDLQKSSPAARFLKIRLAQIYVRLAHTIIYTSALEAARSPEGSCVVVIPHALSTEELDAGKSGLARMLDAACNRPSRLGVLGRLHPKKRIGEAIRAMVRLPSTFVLEIAGDGIEFDNLVALASDLGVAGRVRWRGAIGHAEREEFLRNIDVLLMPSAFECFGRAAAEAMSFGTPVVVTTTVGIAPLVERYGAGVVVEEGSTGDAIARAVETLSHAGAWSTASAGARALVEEELGMEVHAQVLLSRYGELVDRRNS